MNYKNVDANAYYFIPMFPGLFSRLPSNAEKPILCKVTDIWENYKITLKPVHPDSDYYQSREFYLEDFISLIKEGIIVKQEKPTQQVRQIKWEEPLCGNVKLVHEGWILSE
jgi:hypothetical protein